MLEKPDAGIDAADAVKRSTSSGPSTVRSRDPWQASIRATVSRTSLRMAVSLLQVHNGGNLIREARVVSDRHDDVSKTGHARDGHRVCDGRVHRRERLLRLNLWLSVQLQVGKIGRGIRDGDV